MGGLDARFDRDDILTLVTLYWVTSTIGTSIRDYIDNRSHGTATLPPNARVAVPTGIANFHHSYAHEGIVPREWAERIYNITRFTDMPSGGHFAPSESPDLLAAEIATFFSRGRFRSSPASSRIHVSPSIALGSALSVTTPTPPTEPTPTDTPPPTKPLPDLPDEPQPTFPRPGDPPSE